MKTIIHKSKPVKTCTLEQFADEHDLIMDVTERDEEMQKFTGHRFYASFRGVSVLEDGLIISSFGNGDNPKDAIQNYADDIEGALLRAEPHGTTSFKVTKTIQAPAKFVKS